MPLLERKIRPLRDNVLDHCESIWLEINSFLIHAKLNERSDKNEAGLFLHYFKKRINLC